MKLSLIATFVASFFVQIPDPEKADIWRRHEFKAKFKMFPQTEEHQEILRKKQEEQGVYGFLNEILVEITDYPKDMEFTDEVGAIIDVTEWCKRHLILQQDLLVAFWNVINKSAKEKNAKKSR